jgi:hypothetical protein
LRKPSENALFLPRRNTDAGIDNLKQDFGTVILSGNV